MTTKSISTGKKKTSSCWKSEHEIFAHTSVSDRPFAIGIPAIIWQVLFFYIPLLIIVVTSFLKTTPSGIVGITFEKIAHFFNPLYLRVIASSLVLAFINVILCFLIAYPLAYFLAFKGRRIKNFLLFLLLIPFWTNFLLHVYAWFYVLERHGFLNNILIQIGLIKTPLILLNSYFAIIIMMVYYYLPFMVLPIYTSLERFNTSLIEASFDLGATWLQTFSRIILPLTMRGVRAGFFFVYIPSFGEFAIPHSWVEIKSCSSVTSSLNISSVKGQDPLALHSWSSAASSSYHRYFFLLALRTIYRTCEGPWLIKESLTPIIEARSSVKPVIFCSLPRPIFSYGSRSSFCLSSPLTQRASPLRGKDLP